MKKRTLIGGLIATLAFFWLIGTLGALECENITTLRAVIQAAIGMAAGWIGLKMTGAELN